MERRIRAMTRPISVSSCSQTLTTRQPSDLNRARCRLSLTLLSFIFSDHQLRLRLGGTKWSGQPCQKQPSTNTHVCLWGSTRSAVHRTPPIGRAFCRNLKPAFLNADASVFSGTKRRRFESMTFRVVKDADSGARARMDLRLTVSGCDPLPPPKSRLAERPVRCFRLGGSPTSRARSG
jgi:hypothetical protein